MCSVGDSLNFDLPGWWLFHLTDLTIFTAMYNRPGSNEVWEVHRKPRTREYSLKSATETLDREGVLAALGYKPEKSWKNTVVLLEKSELCIRCGRKVYPVEKIDVGGLYHRSCFKCKTCNVQLTLKTFHRDVDPLQSKAIREIYCKVHVPRLTSGHVDSEALEIRRALDAQKHASSRIHGTGYEYESHYTPDAMEFRHHAKSVKRRKKVRRRSTLRSYNDFEKFGVFDAQSTLEELHRKEEDELYKQMAADRKRHIERLERLIADEKKRTVAELTAWFSKRGSSEEEKKMGIKKIENFYAKQREERLQLLLQRLTIEEQAAVARMIEKHSQEMLVLIQEKEREAEKAMKFQFRESQLLEGGSEAFSSDENTEEDYSEDGYENNDQYCKEEGEEESQEENTESFSEASYRVEQCENMNGIVQTEQEYRLSPAGQDVRKLDNMKHSCVEVLPVQTEQGSGRSFQRQDGKRTFQQQHNNGSNVQKLGFLQKQSEQFSESSDQRIPELIHPSSHKPASVLGQSASSLPESVHHPEIPPLKESNRGMSLSQQLLNVNPPFEYLQMGSDENGTVVVKVHAAQDAHLIDDSLRSHHYCTSPTTAKSRPQYYDVSKSPKATQPRSRTNSKNLGTWHSRSVNSPLVRDKTISGQAKSKANTKNSAGKYMLLKRPEDLQESQFSEGEGANENSSSQEQSGDSREHMKKKPRTGQAGINRKARTVSSDNLFEESQEKLFEDDHQEKIHDLVKSEALKAQEALRAMNQGIGNDPLLSSSLFLDPSPIAPKVVPPKLKKSALYTNPSVFKEFDDNAIKETKREHKTFTELVRQLSRHCETELQRVRSIFRWITAKDLNKLQFADNLASDTPMGLLRGIKLGVESYHNLFKRLCSYAGLHCEIIEGYSKGAGYKPGSRLQGNAFRNQWTAVFVDGAWRFVNCNWGARHVKGPRDEHMTYKCDEFYFLTDPEDHIYQHFPDNPNWQLLSDPISLDQFIKLPLLKSPFFNNRLALAADYESVVHTSDGSVEIRIISRASLTFAAQLKPKDVNVKPEVLQDRVLIRRVNEEVIFLTKLPIIGKYFLEIYCGHHSEADAMDNVCSFRFCCYAIKPNTHISFPPTLCFGRTAFFRAFDIREETHSDPYVVTHGTELLIALLCRSTVQLTHSLTFWNHRDRKLNDCDRYAFIVHRSEHMASYILHCPRRGGYVFSLFAAGDQEKSHPLEPVCIYRYYIECPTRPSETIFPLPKASKRWQHCRLIEPLNGNLEPRSRVRFRIESASAIEMVINVNETWHGLHKSGSLWQGSVNTGENNTKLSVYGRFDKNKDKYIPLLEYQVKQPHSLKDIKTLARFV